MKTVLLPLLITLAGLLRSRALLHLEILALRQQLGTLAARDRKRPRIQYHERLFWVWLYRIWPGCVDTLALVKPDTLVRWHRQGFRRYWTWKSGRGRGGQPSISPEIRALIRRLSGEGLAMTVGGVLLAIEIDDLPAETGELIEQRLLGVVTFVDVGWVGHVLA